MQNFATYKYSLLTLAQFLQSINELRWSTRLCEWACELESATDDEETLKAHVLRTRNALSGMGSLGDLSISHRNGLARMHPESLLPVLNRRFLSLLDSLEELTAGGLAGKARDKRGLSAFFPTF